MLNKTFRELLKEAAEKLESAHVPDPRFDARALIMSAFELDTAHFLLYEDKTPMELCPRVLSDEAAVKAAAEVFNTSISRREKREPLQQILGTAGFYGLDFKVTRDVLCPRADTETMIDAVLGNLMPDNVFKTFSAVISEDECDTCSDIGVTSNKLNKNITESGPSIVDRLTSGIGIVEKDDAALLDICTGTGCIAITLAKFGHFKEVSAVDISDAALKIATYNKDNLLTEEERNHFKLFKSDMFSEIHSRFDVIVSNPPYIPSQVVGTLEPEVKDYEPLIALDGTEDGLKFYRILAEESPKHLNDGGFVLFEIGYDQGEAVAELLRHFGFRDVTIIKDFADNERVVMGHL